MRNDLTNPLWRTKSIYSIVNKEGKTVPFRPNNIQELIRQDQSLRKMILKARQFGVSTSELIRMFDWVCFNTNATACIIAHEQDSIKKLFRIVQRAYKFWPKELEHIKPKIDRGGGSKYEMYFPDINSRIYCDLESRSDTIGWLHISEAAFMKDSAKLKATLQTVPINGRVTLETTANGLANHYYDMWIDTDQPYKKLFFPWFIFPEYQLPVFEKVIPTEEEIIFIKAAKKNYGVSIKPGQILYRRFKKAELKRSAHDKTLVTFEQEYPEDDVTCFLSSGDAVFDLFTIKKMIDNCPSPLSDKEGLKIFKKPDKTKMYVIGADPAEGVNKDWSVGVVIEASKLEVVAKVRGQFKPSVFAEKLSELGKDYSSTAHGYPLLGVERNNHGHAVLLALDQIELYPAIYVNKKDERPGWLTSNLTRSIIFNRFRDAIEEQDLIVNDKEILNECLTLVDNNGKLEASDGKHDDCIAASAIALQLILENPLSVYDDISSKIRI